MTDFHWSKHVHNKPAHARDIHAWHNERWTEAGYTNYFEALKKDSLHVWETDGWFHHQYGDHEYCTMAQLNTNFNQIRRTYSDALNTFGRHHADARHDVDAAKAEFSAFMNNVTSVGNHTNIIDHQIDFATGAYIKSPKNGKADTYSVLSGDDLHFALQLSNYGAIASELEKVFGHRTGEGLTKDDFKKLASFYNEGIEGGWNAKGLLDFEKLNEAAGKPFVYSYGRYSDEANIKEVIYFAKIIEQIDARVDEYNAWAQRTGHAQVDSFFNFISKQDGHGESITKQDVFALLEKSTGQSFFTSDQWSIANMEGYIDKRAGMAMNV